MARFASTVELALGADLTAIPSSWTWTDVTQFVHAPSGITITRGRPDWYSQTPPARCSLTFINNGGRFVPRNPTGPYYGQLARNTPLRVRLGNTPSTQFIGYVDEWPTTWVDASGNQSFAPIVCSGLLRRIQQGQVLKSALFRAHTQGYFSSGPTLAYWPMEDASGSGSLASGIGAAAMEYVDFSLGSDSTIAGSEPLPTAGTNAYLYGTVPAYASSTTWAVRFVTKVPQAPSVNSGFVGWSTPGSTIIFWLFVLNSDGTYTMQGYNSALADVLGASSPAFEDQNGASLYGQQVYVEVNGTQNGSNIDWDINLWSGSTGVGMVGSVAGTIGNVTDISHRASPGFTTTAGYTIGHIAISNDSGFGAGTYGATGYSGERTDTRFIRLCAEENISGVFGDLSHLNEQSDQLMGPQPTASLIAQLREVADTEAGILHDGKQGDITILPRGLRYNQAVSISLTVASGQLGWPFEARDDDQLLRNDITASRPRGSSARATDSDSVTAVGVYSDSVTVNTQTDAELFQHASWRVHLGTVEELRYPSIELDFARSSSLITSWQAADIGSRIQITGPPSELPPDTLDLIIEGYTEHFDGFEWTATLNTSPALPWQTTTLEASGNRGRLDTAGCSLLSGHTAGATSLAVGTTVLPKWSTSAVPYDWGIAGERVTVTAMSNVTAAFVAAGTAAHADNASVSPGMPAGVQQDDLLLVFAAIRSSGTGTVNTPAGYTALVTFGNMALLAKIHSGSESAPTVSFASGAAGDTCSAQMAAFRGVQALVDSSTTQLNGSAQNIAIPALVGPTRANTLVLWLGWKQIDWTSVATISGGFATEIGEPSTAVGNNQGLVWDYNLQGNAAQPGATSFVVTGGSAAISRSVVIALVSDVQTATVTRAVNGVSKTQSAGAIVSLWKPGVQAL